MKKPNFTLENDCAHYLQKPNGLWKLRHSKPALAARLMVRDCAALVKTLPAELYVPLPAGLGHFDDIHEDRQGQLFHLIKASPSLIDHRIIVPFALTLDLTKPDEFAKFTAIVQSYWASGNSFGSTWQLFYKALSLQDEKVVQKDEFKTLQTWAQKGIEHSLPWFISNNIEKSIVSDATKREIKVPELPSDQQLTEMIPDNILNRQYLVDWEKQFYDGPEVYWQGAKEPMTWLDENFYLPLSESEFVQILTIYIKSNPSKSKLEYLNADLLYRLPLSAFKQKLIEMKVLVPLFGKRQNERSLRCRNKTSRSNSGPSYSEMLQVIDNNNTLHSTKQCSCYCSCQECWHTCCIAHFEKL